MRPCLTAVLFLLISTAAAQADSPAPMLAKVYHVGDPIDLPQYRVSEKFDGVRAIWDGTRLLSRQGHPIPAPSWFIAGWPPTALDGELWAGRGKFELASATVRRQSFDDAQWRQIRYEVFDAPSQPGSFDERLVALSRLIPAIDQPWVELVEQSRGSSVEELQQRLDQIVAGGGEGLMLHRSASRYEAGRSDDLLKFKPYDDAEAVVIGHTAGKGKYKGKLGALLVETATGLRFGVGSGLSDEDRQNPPPIGSTITFAYHGTTRNGLPRFASFLRVRRDGP